MAPYQPYAEAHKALGGPGDARPTAIQVVKDCDAVGKLKGKTVLITGCSAGLGIETARAMYETGANLFLTARDMKKLDGVIEDIVKNAEIKDAPKPQAIEMHLDSLASVRKGAEDFKQKSGGKLNILIENAGVMAAPFGNTKDGLETQIGTNHFAHFLLFELVKPLLVASAKESGATSRVVILSSAGHRIGGLKFSDKAGLDAWNKGEGFEKWGSYGQSKTSNVYMANELTRKFSGDGILGWSVHPGGIMTDLARHLVPGDLEGAMGDAESLKKMQETTFKNPPQGAATTVWAAVSPHFEGKNGGQYLEDIGETALQPPGADLSQGGHAQHAYDPEKEAMLWKLSCEVVGVPQD